MTSLDALLKSPRFEVLPTKGTEDAVTCLLYTSPSPRD